MDFLSTILKKFIFIKEGSGSGFTTLGNSLLLTQELLYIVQISNVNTPQWP
jgi:hypothetical protein